MRLAAISDTHGQHAGLDLPNDCDVLVHAGDGTSRGSMRETLAWAAWMKEQAKRFKYVVVIGGNHDFSLEHFMREGHEELVHEMFYPAYYLRDTSLHIEGKNFYGSPWQPRFFDWAFNADRGPDIAQHWAKIPRYTHVLITHGPPMGILDWVGKERVGCADLRVVVEDIQPQVHIFGHIHGGYGVQKQNGTEYYNAALLNDSYKHPGRKPWVIDL